MSAFLRKYNTATTIVFPLIDATTDDLTASAAHASGDTKIIKDEGAIGDTTNGFVDETNGYYSIALTATEMSAARIIIRIVDQTSPKVWRDQTILIETYGNASGQHPFDLGSANVTVGSIAADAITASAIADNAIDAGAIASNAITAAKIADDAVTKIQGPLVNVTGTADSGSTTTMVDAARTEGDADYWKGSLIVFTSGTLLGQCRIITDFNAGTDTFTFAPATTQAVSTHTYAILPNTSVWDDVLSEHLTAGSTGAALNSAGSAGDPWATALPGAYGAGTAGKIVGDNINATVSSRATQTSVDTIDDFVDTEVAAIKAKTDQLTFTTPNKVDSTLNAAGDVAAAVANKLADHTLRRTFANARASSDGDAVSLRSLLGGLAKLVNKWSISGTTLTIFAEDDLTSLGTQTVTTTGGANPITQIDTD